MSFHLCKTVKLILDVVTSSFGWFGRIKCIYLVYLRIGFESCDTSQKLHPQVYLYTYFGVGCESCDWHVTKVASTGLFIYLFWGQMSSFKIPVVLPSERLAQLYIMCSLMMRMVAKSSFGMNLGVRIIPWWCCIYTCMHAP